MIQRRLVLLALIGVVLIVVGVTAARMITVANTMNAAAAYAVAHSGELSVPQPLPASAAYDEPPVKVEAVARYGDANAVEVQITRRYQTARRPEAQFTVTYFYQPTTNGWQLVSMPDSFWGDSRSTTGGDRLIVHYMQRDSRLVENLVKAADPALEAACERWVCPPGAVVVLQFLPQANVNGELVYPSPRFTGLPASLEANDDYLSHLTADAILALAKQLGQLPEAARAEIQRQNLYAP
ncbi:MAG: hypothetical protein HYZ49_07675 [Chloroflexi bacterium]|nr:hypothetical protein [Chloroflexota bacterium]